MCIASQFFALEIVSEFEFPPFFFFIIFELVLSFRLGAECALPCTNHCRPNISRGSTVSLQIRVLNDEIKHGMEWKKEQHTAE